MKNWLRLTAVAVVVAALLLGIHLYRYRFVRHNPDLVRLLPPGDLNLIYADLGLLRQAQLLGLLANIKVAPDQEYADFIRDTGFDYTRDLDAIAIATDPSQTFLIGRGRFEWTRLKEFARRHQGSCDGEACRVPASMPGRWVNFVSVQPDVLAVAISPSQTAADIVRPPGRRLQEQLPAAPVWAKFSHEWLVKPVALPLPAQIFAISVQSAESVAVSAEPSSLQLKAHFPNVAAADTARRQLDIQTRTLTAALFRNNERPDRATFTGLLAAGSFRTVGTDVLGSWPIYPELIKALQ